MKKPKPEKRPYDELDFYVQKYGTHRAAAKATGISISQFRGIPTVTNRSNLSAQKDPIVMLEKAKERFANAVTEKDFQNAFLRARYAVRVINHVCVDCKRKVVTFQDGKKSSRCQYHLDMVAHRI